MDWIQWVTSGGALGALGLALATYLRTRPAMRSEELKGEEALWREINNLRSEAKSDRQACEERVERMQERHNRAIDEMKAEHQESLGLLEAEIRVLRHDRNNLRAGFNAMLAMLKRPDANVPEVIAAVEEMVARGDEVIAIERTAIARVGK
jgi:hypothetical protein